MSSRAKMKKRRTRLARAERKREHEQLLCKFAESMRRPHEESLRRRDTWYRRLLRRLTGGRFG